MNQRNETDRKTLAIVTGASRREGIGFALCRLLAHRGMQVILTARDGHAATARAEELQAENLDVAGRQLDITNLSSINKLRDELEADPGRVDVLINNAAGLAPYGEKAASADLTVARAVMEATLFGTWAICQAFLPLLRKSPHPRIVNVSSGAGSHGDAAFGLTTANSMGTSYAVAKAALNALTVKLANEERESRVLVNAVCPGFTATFEGGAAMGARPVEEGAASVAWAAFLDDDGPTGGFFRDGKPLPW